MAELYAPVEEALAAVEARLGAAEAHGRLCGMLTASGMQTECARWIAEVLEDTAPRGDAAKACLALLSELYASTREALDDPELGFHLLLPDDTEHLAVRAAALGSWCEGYLLGLGVGGLQPETGMPGEVAEVLRDLGEISRVEPDPEDDEENEHAYEELVEYVRVGVLLIREHERGQGPAQGQADGHEAKQRLH